MNEAGDIPSVAVNSDRVRLQSDNPSSGSTREADTIAYRLVELQCSPIRGGFDSAHLQNIHHFIFQGLHDGAGELRRSDPQDRIDVDLEQSLNRVLDRLSADNFLRGLSAEDWTRKATELLAELGKLRPFASGGDVALREFAVELAHKNQMSLQWNASEQIAEIDTLKTVDQRVESTNLRRMIMLAMDKCPSTASPSRGDMLTHGIDRTLQRGLHPFDG